ncbi:hypothetical protein K501DRAFT_308622 [Backusella circina FSU 941]|nr:hypothetical protein K501DRAFT_308622 [Backusella circina FSU 941]
MTRLIVLIAIFLQCCNAQLVGPTVTPTSTDSNNGLGSAATLTPDLTDNSLSSLLDTTPTPSTQQTIIIISGCGNTCSRTSSGSQVPTASETTQVNDTDLSADNHKKNVIIIACSVVAEERGSERVALITIKHRQLSLDLIKMQKEMHRTSNDDNDQNNDKISPPVVLYTDVMKQSEQRNGKASARLSKYNVLAQMFTQMKESYSLGAMVLAQDSVNRDDDRIQIQQNNHFSVPEKGSLYQQHNLEKNSVNNSDQSSQLNSYQMNHLYPINQDRLTANSASTPLPETGRDSTTTVGTLHAPLFKNNGLYPPRAHTKPKTTSPVLNKRSSDSSGIANSDDLDHNKSMNTRIVENTGSSRSYNFF